MSDEMKALFEQSSVPAPRGDLADRIAAAAPARAANDNPRWGRRAAGLAAVAASLAFAVFALSPSDPAEEWEQYAELSGFGELYAWVEGEDG